MIDKRGSINQLTDFWNFSRYSCALSFWPRAALLCIEARAASTGAKACSAPPCLEAILNAMVGDVGEGKDVLAMTDGLKEGVVSSSRLDVQRRKERIDDSYEFVK
jgi:hypothetical protein